MAQSTLSPFDFIQNAFSPMVGAMCSPQVEQSCRKNNLSFADLVQPFCKLTSEGIDKTFIFPVMELYNKLQEFSGHKDQKPMGTLVARCVASNFRDPSGVVVTVKHLRINICDVNARPPQPILARKMLNDAVLLTNSERMTTMHIGDHKLDIPSSLPWFETWRDTFLQVQFPSDHEFTRHLMCCLLVVSSADANPNETLLHMALQLNQTQGQSPSKLPKWFGMNVLRCYVLLHDAAEGDNDKAQHAFDNMKQSYGVNQCFLLQINSRPLTLAQDTSLHLPDPWSQFLMKKVDVQDSGSEQDSNPRTPIEVGVMPGVVLIDTTPTKTTPTVTTPISSAPPTPIPPRAASQQVPGSLPVAFNSETVSLHPLSPEMEQLGLSGHIDKSNTLTTSTDSLNLVGSTVVNSNVWSSAPSTVPPVPHGLCLGPSDLEALKCFVQDFTVRALLPHVEKQIAQISDMITNKKGVSRSLFSATKRWFGTNKPGQPNSATSAVVYSPDASELQLRRLGDLCFMFQHYSMAFQAYHSAKRDFSADQAWLHYAGALEMAALSAFMLGESNRKTCDYMEESIITYLNYCKMPQFATRATLLSAEYLRSKQQYGEAAKQLIRMTSEDSDLRSALLLEQASYCFLNATKPRMVRKYAFHIVLAGHRFSKAGQKRHSLRCYKQAYQVYESRGWRLAEDHINFSIGRQAGILRQGDCAAPALARLLTPGSQQTPQQQVSFLREFLHRHQATISTQDPLPVLPVLPLPSLISRTTCVLTAPMPPLSTPGRVPATGTSLHEVPPAPLLGVGSIRGPVLIPNVSNKPPGTDQWARLEEVLVHEAQGTLPMIFKPSSILFTHETNNTFKPTAIIGEPVQLSVELQNPLQVPLPLLDIRLLWTFMFGDVTVSNEPLLAGYPVDYTEQYLQTLVCTQSLDSLLLSSDSSFKVTLIVTPLHVGDLKITGVAYRLTNQSSSLDQTHVPVSVSGKQMFNIQGPRLKNSKEKDGQFQYAVDKRLEISVVPEAPCLQVSFSDISTDLLCEELQPVTVELRNVGSCDLTKLYVATPTPWLISVGGWARNRPELPPRPKKNGEPLKLFKEEPIEFDSPTLRDGVSRKQYVTGIPLPGENILLPGQMHSITLCLRTPPTRGPHIVNLLFYYENTDASAVPRYRLLRHSWNLSVHDSVHITAVAKRSEVINTISQSNRNKPVQYNQDSDLLNKCSQGLNSTNKFNLVHRHNSDANSEQVTCNEISNSLDNDYNGEAGESLNINLTVKNLNQVHHPLMTEISLLQATLLSPCWKLDDVCITPDIKLQTQELNHLILRAHRILPGQNKPGYQVMSDVHIAQSNYQHVLNEVSCSDFIRKHKTSYINIFENVSISELNTQTQKLSKVSKVIEKNINNIHQLNSTLIIKWFADVTDHAGNVRPAIGQHYINIDKLNSMVKVPADVSSVNVESNGQLILFGPERVSDVNGSGRGSEDKLDVHQHVLHFSVHHQREVLHDFHAACVCIVPVTITILNNSDIHLDIRIDTSTDMSVSTSSLTSGGASGSFRWVGLSQGDMSVKAHSSTQVGLHVAVGAPRAYDLGARLSILAVLDGDLHRQACRVNNVLVVKQTS